MTESQFDAGWVFLMAQPFAYPYRTDRAAETVQRRFYFDAVRSFDGATWVKVARDHACGSKWPSLDEIRSSLRLAQVKPRQVEDQRPPDQPEAIVQILELAKESGISFTAAMRRVLPDWVNARPNDEFAKEMLRRLEGSRA